MPRTSHSPRALLKRALDPLTGFRACASRPGDLGQALGRMVLWRAPFWTLSTLIQLEGYRRFHQILVSPLEPRFQGLVDGLGMSAVHLRALGDFLPAAPAASVALPWIAALSPLAVLSLWMHHWAWDHLALWMLRGVGPGKARASALAEAEALTVGVLVRPLTLLAEIPYLGWIFATLGLVGGIYAWALRGIALAAWHECPLWKGIAATLLHLVLVGLFYGAVAVVVVLAAFAFVA